MPRSDEMRNEAEFAAGIRTKSGEMTQDGEKSRAFQVD